jgi:hypothetical protein
MELHHFFPISMMLS